MEGNKLQFVEDKISRTPLREVKIPEKSIEGWFYKHIPGNVGLKKFILSGIIILLFIASAILFIMSLTNSTDRPRTTSLSMALHQFL